MAEKKKKAWAAEDCEDWGGYMAAKKAKLEEQFHEAAAGEFENPSTLFNGIAIFVNGYTNPTADELKRLMMKYGGIYHHYLRPQTTTHLIASNLPYSKIVAYQKAAKPLPLCKPEWITDSIEAGTILDHRKYLLYSQSNKTQPQIFNLLKKNTDKQDESSSNSNSPVLFPLEPPQKMCTKNSEFLSEFYNNSRLHLISTMGTMFKDYINELRSNSDKKFPGLENLLNRDQTIARFSYDPDSEDELIDVEKLSPLEPESHEKIIMHIDMDCFFVSVGLRNHPELRGQPVAVAHAKGNKKDEEHGSMSEIASCSYEARKAGVKNGMFLGQALKLCPNLKTISYDFEGYKEVAYVLYDTVASYTLDIEAVSCDEMYADITDVLNSAKLSPLEFAKIIREEIKTKTGCPVSTGFGLNKLQARLSTKKAKPDGQCFLRGENFKNFIGELGVRELPGVGYSTTSKLREMNIKLCSELETVSLSDLQQEFGKKTGEQLYKMCRGIDDSKLNFEHVRKTVSAEVNYGIRFENRAEAKEFLEKLSLEVSIRLKKANVRGRCVTLKVMLRAKDAAKETRKFMGHGVCDSYNKSKNLIAATDDPVTIAKEVQTLWDQMVQVVEDARGIGIQMTKLESKDNGTKNNIMKFFQKQPVIESVISEPTTSRDPPKAPKTVSKNNCIQPKQIEFFKEKKFSTKNNGSSKLPEIQEIDMSVLNELPPDIQKELLNEYRKNGIEAILPKNQIAENHPAKKGVRFSVNESTTKSANEAGKFDSNKSFDNLINCLISEPSTSRNSLELNKKLVDKSNEILSNLVECLLELPLSQVKMQIQTWVENFENINEVDFLSFTTYLGSLPRKKRLEDLYSLLKCLYRFVLESESCAWHETYKKTLEHVQARMRTEYNCNLMIPNKISCDKCEI